MPPESLIFLYVCTGLSLGFSLLSLILGLQKQRDKIYLIFGYIGISFSVYYFIYPYLEDPATKGIIRLTGILFILIGFGLFPLFFRFYSGYRNRFLLWSIPAGLVFNFFLFILSLLNLMEPFFWTLVSHILLSGIILYGLLSIRHLKKAKNKTVNIFMWLVMAPLILLAADDIFLFYFKSYSMTRFHAGLLPLDFFPIFFVILMGARIVRDFQLKLVAEKENASKEKQWHNLLERVKMLIIQVAKDGTILYVNPYLFELTGYTDQELINQHYIKLIPDEKREESMERFSSHMEVHPNTMEKRWIRCKDGRVLIINWSVVTIYDINDHQTGILAIGVNVTQREQAFEEIETLKKQLETENITLKMKIAGSNQENEIIGQSEAFLYVINRAREVAETNANVILEGETGSGKEVIARYIHRISQFSQGPFITVNCPAIPKDLLESELFGHEKGAFTGAAGQKKGWVELADNGTLFLDEVGDLPLDIQPKLLRFIQDGKFNRLGSEKENHVVTRIIAATNKNLKEEVENGKFREDLFFRLHVFPITIPPLRKRRSDIPLLVQFFVHQFGEKYNKTIHEISKHDIEQLREYDWPGNIRELENVIESAVIRSRGKKMIIPKLVNIDISKNRTGLYRQIDTLEEMDRKHILDILELCNWQISGEDGAAAKLGLHPNTLRSRMVKLGISKSFR